MVIMNRKDLETCRNVLVMFSDSRPVVSDACLYVVLVMGMGKFKPTSYIYKQLQSRKNIPVK